MAGPAAAGDRARLAFRMPAAESLQWETALASIDQHSPPAPPAMPADYLMPVRWRTASWMPASVRAKVDLPPAPRGLMHAAEVPAAADHPDAACGEPAAAHAPHPIRFAAAGAARPPPADADGTRQAARCGARRVYAYVVARLVGAWLSALTARLIFRWLHCLARGSLSPDSYPSHVQADVSNLIDISEFDPSPSAAGKRWSGVHQTPFHFKFRFFTLNKYTMAR